MYLARITIFGQARGGRIRKVGPGYRPHLRLGEIRTTCFIYPVDQNIQMFELDTEYLVVLRLLLSPESYMHRLQVGEILEFSEGNKIVGEGAFLQNLEEEEYE